MKLVCLGAVPQAIKIFKNIQKMDKNIELVGFLDNDESKWDKNIYDYPVFGGMSKVQELAREGCVFCNLITSNAIVRYETTLELVKRGAKLTNFIYPDVDLKFVKLGIGNYIQECVNLQANVSIGDNSSIHVGTIVGHETNIGNSVFIAHGCNISGAVNIEDGVFVGTGVTITPRVKIGKWSVIGAGSLILKDVPPYSVVVGNPQRIIKSLEQKYENGQI